VHGFRCYDNIRVCQLIALYTAIAYNADREMSASACTRSMADLISDGSLNHVLFVRQMQCTKRRGIAYDK